ncbi:spatacsin [Centroberyx affinis]|uniref:spatacsin n=1 Tax=Centroberyx affinis TaxID=166261 RepID=UPI003A5C0DD1
MLEESCTELLLLPEPRQQEPRQQAADARLGAAEPRQAAEPRAVRRAALAPAGSLLCCLELQGGLRLWDPADPEAPPAALPGGYTDFSWEAEPVSGLRLLVVGSQCEVKLLQVETGSCSSVSLRCVSECSADHLLQILRDQDPGVCELRSVCVLSFAAGRCGLLLNGDSLLRLQWQQEAQEPQELLSCCSLQLEEQTRLTAALCCLSRGNLFVLTATGHIRIFDCADGTELGSVELPVSLSSGPGEEEPAASSSPSSSSASPSSFCLLQVSADLSTAVAVTQSHAAVALDLNHYFRTHPDRLPGAAAPARPPLPSQHPREQDALSSSACSLAGRGRGFSPDRSWEARLASMYTEARRAAPPPSPPPSWFSSSPRSESRPAPSRARPSRGGAPPWGTTVVFSVPESSVASHLSVSEFSALLTFVSPGDGRTTVAFWDLESQSVSYHRTEGEATAVQRCGETQHRLLLKKSGLFLVLFSVSQQALLSRLMLFGSAATVDAVCHLNSWGRCSVPVHALQAGLKNRQLDTVDFYLKSKENVLDPSAGFCPPDQPAASTPSLSHGMQDLVPALDLLCSAVRESNSEAQSRQFSEQLLHITMSFIHTQLRFLLTHTHCEDSGLQSCVELLDRYVTELRSYMKRFPWPAGGAAGGGAEEVQGEEWDHLSTEELVRQAVLTNQIPRAQAVLRRRGRPEQRMSDLRMEGLRQAFCCLQLRDLKTASTLLQNMGFSVKEQLHRICLYTDDKDLRDFVEEELWRRSHFPEEEQQSAAFIREMEKLSSLPAVRSGSPLFLLRFVQMLRAVPGGEEVPEVLEVLVGQRRTGPEEEPDLWRNVRLDWVRNWDQSSQTPILLSRLHHSELSSCDAGVLWRHLTSLHDRLRVVDWIRSRDGCGAPRWPELTPELVSSSTACSSFMKENILDLLARGSVFVQEELTDLERLLWRLGQGGGVMAAAPPAPRLRSPLGLDLHGLFITFCLDRSLHYLLYTYLEHYRLTPRNCPLLASSSLSESQPWFEMLVKIQEITRDLTDPVLVFQSSLTSSQVLLPGGQASLSSLLLEGHSLLALATIMFCPGGIHQVVQGERSGRSERTVDPQLLKMALAPHPKLRAALFPAGPRGHAPPSDLSVYHLLQSLHPLDPSRLFGWQAANTLNSTESSELPHFSAPQLVSRFALQENLDFLFYLRHGRPTFAFATFLLQQLSGCSDVRPLLQQAYRQAYRLALQCFNEPSVAAAAVCFSELLGADSLKLRVQIRAMNTLCNTHTQALGTHTHTHKHTLLHWVHTHTHTHTHPSSLSLLSVSKGVRLAEAEPGAAEELIGCLEAAVTASLEQRGISRSSYEAVQEWALPVQFCQLHSLPLSPVCPAHCAADGQFIHFLLFVQLHGFPPPQVRSLAGGFGPALQAHLSLAFQDLQSGGGRSQAGGEERPGELFQVLLRSQEEAQPSGFLLQEALLQHCPTLAVLAACHQEAELLQCLCVWVLTSVDDVTAAEAAAHLADAPQHHEWTLHDLSIIWKTLLGRGHVRPLLRGFRLFLRDCPLVLVLRMFELCCDYRSFSEAKVKLLDFQKTLITLRSGGPAAGGPALLLLPLQWMESQASVLLLSMLRSCSSRFDLHRLLLLLADVDKMLKSNGPDFRKLSQLSELLQGSEVSVSPRLLQSVSSSVQQEELQAAVERLQAAGRYGRARRVAQLAGLPGHRLLLRQLVQEVNSQKAKRQWGRLETRVGFWRKCHDQLKADGTDPDSASRFFVSQAEAQSGSELLGVQERCLLLQLAGHWLSLLRPAPLARLESLEKKLWTGRVRRHVLVVAMETESVFNLPPPAVSPETNSYETLVKEFSFSNISALNEEKSLSLEGLPGPTEEERSDDSLAPEEKSALAALIGQLLDEGSIHEASRVCRYFSLHHPDLWLVLRCRGLASGELNPEPQEVTSEAPPTRSMASSASFSSLSSFVMLPLPEDQVVLQLQVLVDQCRHGNNYCKQVLSLYQLSKELQVSFSQMCREEPGSVLEKLLQSEQPERFRKAQAFIRAQALPADAVAQLLSSAVVQALLASSQEPPPDRQVFRPAEGRDSLVQLIKLCDDPNLVGVKLLEKLNAVPLRELSCIVELLIVAHDCFSLTCNMEGIVRVLQAARHLSHAHLAPGGHYSLLVRLLAGIGRYNEMTYVFDLLHQNHRFEILLRKKVETDRGQSSSLKTALLDYIKRCLPADSEKHNMVALCFSMRREIGENHEMAARTQLKIIESQPWVVTSELKSALLKVLGLLKDAAESYSKDSCVRQASRCVRTAKLVLLQLHFLNQGSEQRVINLRPAELLSAMVALPRCYQVFVLSEAYGVSPDWAEVLFQKVILNGDFVYLEELKRHRPLSAGLFEDIFKNCPRSPSSLSAHLKRLLTHCDDAYSRYRLAYQQQLYDVTNTLLQDAKTAAYLSDRLAS